ncbi:uncharacterized protein VTP21DRAFT_8172 [Calcarisporiella thermophila]|uniref:uncharacterized protein n=1 Tax=Calcarisporiella thermophila TaxID=911321 RepID=UPI003742DCB4
METILPPPPGPNVQRSLSLRQKFSRIARIVSSSPEVDQVFSLNKHAASVQEPVLLGLHLDSHRKFYLPGQTIHGHVTIRTPTPAINIHACRVGLTGRAQVRGKEAGDPFEGTFLRGYEDRLLLNVRRDLTPSVVLAMDQRWDDARQTLKIRFSLTIPMFSKLPGTHKHKHFPIRYEVQASLVYESLLFKGSSYSMATAEKEILLRPLLITNAEPLCRPFISAAKEASRFCGGIQVDAYLTRRGYLPGEVIPLQVRIRRAPSEGKLVVQALIKKYLVLLSGAREVIESEYVTSSETTVNLDGRGEKESARNSETADEPQDEIIVKCDIALPRKASYSILPSTTQGLFSLHYILQLRVGTRGWLSTPVKLTLPLVIASDVWKWSEDGERRVLGIAGEKKEHDDELPDYF